MAVDWGVGVHVLGGGPGNETVYRIAEGLQKSTGPATAVHGDPRLKLALIGCSCSPRTFEIWDVVENPLSVVENGIGAQELAEGALDVGGGERDDGLVDLAGFFGDGGGGNEGVKNVHGDLEGGARLPEVVGEPVEDTQQRRE